MNVIDNLMRDPAIVLQDVVVLCSYGFSNPLCDGQDLGQVFVRQLVQLGGVILGDYERVAPAQRVDVEEGEDFVALEELQRRDVT